MSAREPCCRSRLLLGGRQRLEHATSANPGKSCTARCDHGRISRTAAAAIADTLPIAVCEWPAFCDQSRVSDLGRFSQRVSRPALQPTPA